VWAKMPRRPSTQTTLKNSQKDIKRCGWKKFESYIAEHYMSEVW
jgi:hypothetical protein